MERALSLLEQDEAATSRPRRRIALLGVAVGTGNRGVQALGSALVALLQETSGAEIMLLANHSRREMVRFPSRPDQEFRVVPARLSPRSRWADHLLTILLSAVVYRAVPLTALRHSLCRKVPWLDAVATAEWAGDIRGGDSFSDLYGSSRFLVGFLLAWSVLLLQGRLVQLPQTYGPYRRWWARRLARYLLLRSPVILARDPHSRKVANELVEGRKPVLLCPDVAFALPPVPPECVELNGAAVAFGALEAAGGRQGRGNRVRIGVNVNGLMYHGGYNRRNMFGLKLDYPALLPRLIQVLLAEREGQVWLIPHTYGPPDSVESDPEACRRVQEALPEAVRSRVRRLTGEYDCCQLKAVIGLCDFFIGSRMHACIAALSQGIPSVGIAYSRKFRGVFDTVGMGEWVVDGRTTGQQAAIQQVLRLYGRRHEVRGSLAEKATDAQRQLREMFSQLAAAEVGKR